MEILEIIEYEFRTEYKILTDRGIFIHSVSNEKSYSQVKEELKNYFEKMSK
ncbi:hypothetical protein [Staphylococcus succinus]|uniref:hypothetical protein n=1 Tax=Staphylococcus succinus TaxID=61015 RepID=UPI001304DD75|nr:hypothetical protein [Staphylococcus succinus]